MTASIRSSIVIFTAATVWLGCVSIAFAATTDAHTEIATVLRLWKASWQSGDIDRYARHYGPAFSYKGQDLSWWISRKKRLFSGTRAHSVRLSGVCINVKGATATAEFVQRYASDTVSDIGLKKLRLQKEKGQWTISGETWEKLTHEGARENRSGQVEVLSISVVPGQKKRQTNVRFYLSRFAAPDVRVLKEKKQIILQFTDMNQWDGILSIPVGRGPILSVHTYLTNACRDFIALISLRKEDAAFSANQFYYKQEKIFEIQITEE